MRYVSTMIMICLMVLGIIMIAYSRFEAAGVFTDINDQINQITRIIERR